MIYSAMHSQMPVATAYLLSKQLLPFDFACSEKPTSSLCLRFKSVVTAFCLCAAPTVPGGAIFYTEKIQPDTRLITVVTSDLWNRSGDKSGGVLCFVDDLSNRDVTGNSPEIPHHVQI